MIPLASHVSNMVCRDGTSEAPSWDLGFHLESNVFKRNLARIQSKSGTSCEQTSVNKQWQCAIEWGWGVQSKLEFQDLGNQQKNAAFDH